MIIRWNTTRKVKGHENKIKGNVYTVLRDAGNEAISKKHAIELDDAHKPVKVKKSSNK